MSIVWRASVESYQRIIAEKKHMQEELEAELAMWETLAKEDHPALPSAPWYIKNQLFYLNRQLEDLEEWLKKLEERGEN